MQFLQQTPPLSLYIHIPWCVQKCPYCDFNSHSLKTAVDENAYITALINDLTFELPQVWGRRLSSIFIGGGTPSLFSAQAIDQLLSQVRALMPFAGDIEITLEANPGTAEANKFSDFRKAGINRLSIGVQSFNDPSLLVLGRIHDASQALNAIDMAHKAGFERINIDLMHGLPNQSPDAATKDLQQAINTGASHISWYQLTLEPNTAFYQSPPQLPDDDNLADIQEAGESLLNSNRFEQYEVSAFAQHNNLRSQHNLNYWQFGDYLGIGAGAHGKITLPNEQHIKRISKRRHPKDYLNPKKNFIDKEKVIALDELPLEFMMNALRLKEGVPSNTFFQRTGIPLSAINQPLETARQKGLMSNQPEQLKTTTLGQRYLNELLEIFMPHNLSLKLPTQISSERIPIKKID